MLAHTEQLGARLITQRWSAFRNTALTSVSCSSTPSTMQCVCTCCFSHCSLAVQHLTVLLLQNLVAVAGAGSSTGGFCSAGPANVVLPYRQSESGTSRKKVAV